MGTNNQIVVYQTADNQTQINVTLENETVWLTQAQIVEDNCKTILYKYTTYKKR